MSSSSPALDDDEIVSQDVEAHEETTRRRLPVVDSINLGRIINLAEGQVGLEPGYFFSAMPTQRTPKTSKKSMPSASSAKKTRAKKVLAARMAEQEAARKASDAKELTTPTLLRVESGEAKKGLGPTGKAGPSAPAEGKEAASQGDPDVPELPPEQEVVQLSRGSAKQSPRKRPSQGTDGKGAAEPKKLVGDFIPPVGATGTPVGEVEAAPRKDHDISDSPSSDRSSSLSYGSDTDYFLTYML
jgi:hypothetical protein